MKNNSFNIKIRKDVVGFLKKMNLFKSDYYVPEDHYTETVKEISRIGTHKQIYDEICKTYSFDIMLSDDSIYQFHKEGDNYRYCFIQNPMVKYSWEEYLHNNDLKEDGLTEEESNIYRSCYDNNEEDSSDLLNIQCIFVMMYQARSIVNAVILIHIYILDFIMNCEYLCQ